MSELLRLDNFSPNNRREIGRVAFDAAADQKIIKFVSVEGIAIGDILFVGRIGTESVERCVVASISEFDVTMADNLAKEHRRYQPVVAVYGDQLKVYRAAAPDNNSQPAYSALEPVGTPTTIDYDQLNTDFTDPDGGTGFWYAYTFYNSNTTFETAKEDCPMVRGGGYGHYAAISDIRQKAGFADNMSISDSLVDTTRREAEDEINTSLQGFYTLPFVLPIPPKIEEITMLLGAGRLLNAEYGPFNSGGTSRRGDAKLKEGRDLLMKVRTHDTTVLDETLQSLATAAAIGTGGWPDNTTASAPAEEGGSVRMFRSSDRY